MFKWSESDKIVLPLTLLGIIILAVVLRLIFKKREKLKSIPLKVIACILIVLEVSKQIYFIFFREYDLYALPIHFCTLIMFMIICAELLPKKVGKYFKAPALIYSIVVTILVFVNPHALIGTATRDFFKGFHHFHTFCFHFTVIAYFVISVALNSFVPKFSDLISMVLTVVFYATYAVPIAFHFNVNYVNILQSYFEPLEKLRLTYGQFIYDTTLFLLTISASCLLLLIYMGIYKLFNKKQIEREDK